MPTDIAVLRRLQMPLLMTVGMVGSGLFAGLALIMIPAAAFGNITYSLFERPVTAAEYWRSPAGPVLVVVTVWLGAIAVGFRRERLWARPGAAFFWFGIAALSPVMARSAPAGSFPVWAFVIQPAAFGLFAIWYFYSKRSVVAYYAALKALHLSTSRPEAAGA